MLRTVRIWQHVVVGASIALMAALAGFGVVGGGDESVLRPEHFDAKQVTVWPEGADGVRVREVVDIDFGPTARHGYQRIVPDDFGVPTDVTASSPDAPDGVEIVAFPTETRIRIGDPSATVTGRHRYVLEYTLPAAGTSTGELALDIIGNEETFETERFEVVLTGFDFDGTRCDAGAYGTLGGCEFERDELGNQVAVIAPLAPGDGITVGGRFSSTHPPRLPDLPERPGPIPVLRPLGLVMIPLGLAAAGAVYVIGRRYGSNEVLAGGAADAAYGDLPVPGTGARPADVATYRVPDSRLAELATIEFAPPRGVEPWQASALLRETVDSTTVMAWFSEMIAHDALVVGETDGDVTLTRGTSTALLNAVDLGHLTRLFASSDTIVLGEFDPVFTAAWAGIQREQREFVATSGWWSRGGPGGRTSAVPAVIAAVVFLVLAGAASAMFFLLGSGSAPWRALTSPWVAVAAGVLVPLVTAAIMYQPMFASRTATGSALALRAESFRRFLAASEGKHVDWAWEHGLVREYSAWAVALGAAEAWSRAVASSNIRDPGDQLVAPLVVHTSSHAFASTHTAPSSSSGGGGGGGGVGGGGGGGSSGSW